MPHDLDTSTRGIGARLVHRNKQREVLARIIDDDRAKACRSTIFHDYGMQVGIPVRHIVDPGHGLLVESIGHDVNRLLDPAGRLRGSRNRLSEAVICALLRDFDKHGEKAIARVREENPGMYLKVIAMVLPRQHKVEHRNPLKELTDEELEAMIEHLKASMEAQAQSAKLIEAEAVPSLPST